MSGGTEAVERLKDEIAADLATLAKSKEFVSAVQQAFLRWFTELSSLMKDRDGTLTKLRSAEDRLAASFPTDSADKSQAAKYLRICRSEASLRESYQALDAGVQKKLGILNFEVMQDLSGDDECVLLACLHLRVNRSEAMFPQVRETGDFRGGHRRFFGALVADGAAFDTDVFDQLGWAVEFFRELPKRLGFPELADAITANRKAKRSPLEPKDPFSADKREFTWNGITCRLTVAQSVLVEKLYEGKVWGKKSLSESYLLGDDSTTPIRNHLQKNRELAKIVVRPRKEDGSEKNGFWQLVAPKSITKKSR